MADKPPLDPIALMRAVASAWNQVVPPPAPAATADVPTARMMAQALAAANMPSREEISRIADRLERIEQSLARIEQQLEEAARPVKKAKRKARVAS